MQNALAYVSLHRSEGYGLTCAEAMALGTPVIATRYSGNLDFMDDENSLLVDYDMVQVNDPSGTYRVDSQWANPKIDSAVKQIRKVYDDRAFAKRLGLAGMDSITRDSTYESAVEFVKTRLIQFHTQALEKAKSQLIEEQLAEKHNRKKQLWRKLLSVIPSTIRNRIRNLLLD
jgi:glycosyltransferase involved in cell wall biosynthesis